MLCVDVLYALPNTQRHTHKPQYRLGECYTIIDTNGTLFLVVSVSDDVGLLFHYIECIVHGNKILLFCKTYTYFGAVCET